MLIPTSIIWTVLHSLSKALIKILRYLGQFLYSLEILVLNNFVDKRIYALLHILLSWGFSNESQELPTLRFHLVHILIVVVSVSWNESLS